MKCQQVLVLALTVYYFLSHQHKVIGLKIKQSNDHDGILLGIKCTEEGDRIALLERYRQLPEQECGFCSFLSNRG